MGRLCHGVLLVLCTIVLLKVVFAKGKLSDHHNKRYMRQFSLGNANGDGVLELADYELYAQRIYQRGCTRFTKEQLDNEMAPKAFNGYPGKSMTKKEYMQAAETRDCNSIDVINGIKDWANVMFDVWNCKDEGNDEAMNFSEFSDEFEDMRTQNKVNGKEFKQLDTNGDGCISSEEFLESSSVKDSFDAIDANKDGVLSRDEYVDAAVRFLCSADDNDASAAFLGGVE